MVIFTIRDRAGNIAAVSTALPKASAVYELAERCQTTLGLYAGDLKIMDTSFLQRGAV